MIPEQEIRLEALKIKCSGTSAMVAACLVAGRACNADKFWTDGELEEFANYIRDGVKP